MMKKKISMEGGSVLVWMIRKLNSFLRRIVVLVLLMVRKGYELRKRFRWFFVGGLIFLGVGVGVWRVRWVVLALSSAIFGWGPRRPKLMDAEVGFKGYRAGLFVPKDGKRVRGTDIKRELKYRGLLNEKARRVKELRFRKGLFGKKKFWHKGERDILSPRLKKIRTDEHWLGRKRRGTHELHLFDRGTSFVTFRYTNGLVKRKHNKISAGDQRRLYYKANYIGIKPQAHLYGKTGNIRKKFCTDHDYYFFRGSKLSSLLENRHIGFTQGFRLLTRYHRKYYKTQITAIPGSKFLGRGRHSLGRYYLYNPFQEKRSGRGKMVHRYLDAQFSNFRKRRHFYYRKKNFGDIRSSTVYGGYGRQLQGRWYKPQFTYNDVKFFLKYGDLVGTKYRSKAMKRSTIDVRYRFKDTMLLFDQGPAQRAMGWAVFNRGQPLMGLSEEQKFLRERRKGAVMALGGTRTGFIQFALTAILTIFGGRGIFLCYQALMCRWRYYKFCDNVRLTKNLGRKTVRIRLANGTGRTEVFFLFLVLLLLMCLITIGGISFYQFIHGGFRIEIEITGVEVLLGSCFTVFVYKSIVHPILKVFVRTGRRRVGVLLGFMGWSIVKKRIFVIKAVVVGFGLLLLSLGWGARWHRRKWRGDNGYLKFVKETGGEYLLFLRFNNALNLRTYRDRLAHRREDNVELMKSKRFSYYLLAYGYKSPIYGSYNYLGTKTQARAYDTNPLILGRVQFKRNGFRYNSFLEDRIGNDMVSIFDPWKAMRFFWYKFVDYRRNYSVFGRSETVERVLRDFYIPPYIQAALKYNFFPDLRTDEEKKIYLEKTEYMMRPFETAGMRRTSRKKNVPTTVKILDDAEKESQYRYVRVTKKKLKKHGVSVKDLEMDGVDDRVF